jgi:hypothetical protein
LSGIKCGTRRRPDGSDAQLNISVPNKPPAASGPPLRRAEGVGAMREIKAAPPGFIAQAQQVAHHRGQARRPFDPHLARAARYHPLQDKTQLRFSGWLALGLPIDD